MTHGARDARPQYRGGMTTQDITFRTREGAEPEDLKADRTLFGRRLPRWTGEEGAICPVVRLRHRRAVRGKGL